MDFEISSRDRVPSEVVFILQIVLLRGVKHRVVDIPLSTSVSRAAGEERVYVVLRSFVYDPSIAAYRIACVHSMPPNAVRQGRSANPNRQSQHRHRFVHMGVGIHSRSRPSSEDDSTAVKRQPKPREAGRHVHAICSYPAFFEVWTDARAISVGVPCWHGFANRHTPNGIQRHSVDAALCRIIAPASGRSDGG